MLFNKCPSCNKRKLWLSRRWIKTKYLPPVRPDEAKCEQCLSALEKIY